MFQAEPVSRPSYVTAYPVRVHGEIPPPEFVLAKDSAKAFGFLAIPSDSKPVRLMVPTLQDARIVVMENAGSSTTTILAKAVAFNGSKTLFMTLETVELDAGTGRTLEANGMAMAKKAGARTTQGIREMSARLASQLRYDDRLKMEPQIREAIQRMPYKWDSLSGRDMAEAMRDLRTELLKVMEPGTSSMMPMWIGRLDTNLTAVVEDVRQEVRDNYLPSVGLSLNQPDQRVLDQIVSQNGWFLRGQDGSISERLTEKGREIVRSGVEQGLGRNDIAEDLMTDLPTLWDKYGKNYARTVASVATSRARSWAEVSGYQDVGIEMLEVVAMLDERTTSICRFMDGQLISVDAVQGQLLDAASVANPEDISEMAPFISVVEDEDGNYLEAAGERLAEIIRSGEGVRDDHGEIDAYAIGNQLTKYKIGAPPFHFGCRSLTVPVTIQVQVPDDAGARAEEIPEAEAGEEMTMMAMDDSKDALVPASRPVGVIARASREHPVRIGRPSDEQLDRMDSHVAAGSDLEKAIPERLAAIGWRVKDRMASAQQAINRKLTKIEAAKLIQEEALSVAGTAKEIDAVGLPRIHMAGSGMAVSPSKSKAFYRAGLKYASPDLLDQLKDDNDRALSSVLMVPGERRSWMDGTNLYLAADDVAPAHWLQHVVDRVGRNNRAAVWMRNDLAYEGPMLNLPGDVLALRGPWADPYDGRLHLDQAIAKRIKREYPDGMTRDEIHREFDGDQASEFMAGIAERFGASDWRYLSASWERCPKQVLMYLSVMRGQYV